MEDFRPGRTPKFLTFDLFRDGMITMSLGEPDGFACSLAEVVQLRTPCFSASNRPDIQNVRRVEWENPLYALVIDDTPYREVLVNTTAFAGNHRAGKYLCAGFIAFLNAAMYVNDIAYFEMGNLFLQAFALNSIQHFCFH